MLRTVQKMKATRVLFTPSLLQLIVDSLTPEVITSRLGGLRQVILTISLASGLHSRHLGCILLKMAAVSLSTGLAVR